MFKTSYIIGILLCFSSLFCFSQNESVKTRLRNHLTLGLVAFNFDGGPQKIRIPDHLTSDYSFLIKNSPKYFTSFSFLEFQLLYKNFIGLNIGMDYSNKGGGRELIYAGIQDHFDNLSIIIPKTDYESGIVPVTDNQDVFSIKIGLVGKINIGKFSIVPFLSGIIPINKSSLDVKANCIDPNGNISFDRKYSFQGNYQPGLKIGFDTRYMLLNNLFVSARIGYSYIKMNGHGTTVDTFEDGSQIISNSSEFYRINSNLYFGGNIGFIFGYGYKR